MRFELQALWAAAILLILSMMPARSEEIDFEKQIAPIFEAHCVKCHGPAKQQGGLRFDSASGAIKKGDSEEPAIVPGNSAASQLLVRVTSKDDFTRMPPEGVPLSAIQIEQLKRWINAGAQWLDTKADHSKSSERVVTEADRSHWSFRPLRQPAVPVVRKRDVSRTPIDAFIVSALEAKGLALTDQAAPRTLIRRIKMDLVGLPPTPEETAAFEDAFKQDPQATDRLVDSLLGSIHYGERWGRHWLDVARYADSGGQEGDQDRPNAFRYRDFVIQALNADMPFDQFVRWQIAGNELAPGDPLAAAATGFLAAGPSTELKTEPLEKEKARARYIERMRNRYNELDDILSTFGEGMLGLTLGCARCHDHKFDAVPSRDYYRLIAAFMSGERGDVSLGPRDTIKAFVYQDESGEPQPTWLFPRGDFMDQSQPLQLGFLTVLTHSKTAAEYWELARSGNPSKATTFQRAALASWLTDLDQGAGALVARVIVNRVWQHHFGEGLVRTPNDFGVQGERPSHPELLEWLAADLVDHGWQLKRLHRQIMISAVYRQDVTFNDAASRIDPENHLLWRRKPMGLEAEALRDAMLFVAGNINFEPYGPGFKPPIPAEATRARNIKSPYVAEAAGSANVRRRSVYMFHKRVVPHPLMQLFDRPDALQSCGRRQQTLVAPQALALLNDDFARQQAREFALRLIRDQGTTEDRVSTAIERALARPVAASERAAACEFITARQAARQQREASLEPKEAYAAALTDYCQVLFGLNEFLFVD